MKRKLIIGLASLSLIACAGMQNSPQTSLNRQLVRAAEAGHTQEVIALLKAGADIESHDAEGFTPYLAASSKGHLETMRLLKGLGAKTMVDEKYLDSRFVAKVQ